MGFVQDKQTSTESDSIGAMDVEGHRTIDERRTEQARSLVDYAVGGQPPPGSPVPPVLPVLPVQPALPPAMMPGKGVRAVRCVGCRSDTLPRPEDSAPLCQRCSDLLSPTADGPEGWAAQLTPKWLRRRSLYL